MSWANDDLDYGVVTTGEGRRDTFEVFYVPGVNGVRVGLERTVADHGVINSAARPSRRRCRFQRFEVCIFTDCDDRKTFANIA